MKTGRVIFTAVALAILPLATVAQGFEKAPTASKAVDAKVTLEEWRLLAEQGNAIAQYNLGLKYNAGAVFPLDSSDFLRWSDLAEQQGISIRQVIHGEAVHWFRLAAEQGLPKAQNYLGYMYTQGRGVPQDYGEAVRWFRLAAAQNYDDAWFSLGYMYEDGSVTLLKQRNWDQSIQVGRVGRTVTLQIKWTRL